VACRPAWSVYLERGQRRRSLPATTVQRAVTLIRAARPRASTARAKATTSTVRQALRLAKAAWRGTTARATLAMNGESYVRKESRVLSHLKARSRLSRRDLSNPSPHHTISPIRHPINSPAGTKCASKNFEGTDVTLETIDVQKGWWRPSEKSAAVYRCPFPAECIGGTNIGGCPLPRTALASG
jgi:hypothetical protein